MDSILKKMTPNVAAVFWMTKKELASDQLYYSDFNYIFDGLLSEYILNSKDQNKQKCQVFQTKNFDRSFWLVHLHGENFSSEIDEQIALMTETHKNNPLQKKIIIINEVDQKWNSELPKRYTHFQFEILN